MKKLNILLMMLASFSLVTISSCKTDDPVKPIKDITVSVSGGAEVTVEGADLAKDITVTASEKVDRDIVVALTSNAAEGEATITPAQITIPKGEISATSKITFTAAKFPEGTAQKKITVTITSPSEGVEPGTATTDFLVKGAGGPELIVLSVSGGAEVTVEAVDISKDITVTASGKADKDIVVTLTSNAAEGEATIAPAEVTIKKGELSATSKITFALAKFPEGAAQKKITVTIASSSEGVNVGTATTDFLVKGAGGSELIALTVTANGTEFNTTAAIVPVTFTFTLATPNTTEFPVSVTFGEGTSEAIKTMFASLTTVKFAANATAPIVITVDVPKGTEGKLIANFDVEDETIDLKTTTLSATFVVDEDPADDPTFSLVRTTTGEIVVPATGDKAETFNVTLSKASTEEQTITLTVATSTTGKSGVLSPATVVFEPNATSKPVTITFASADFDTDVATANVTVTGASTTLEAGTAAITYAVKGTKDETSKHNIDIRITPSSFYAIFNKEASMIATCSIVTLSTNGFDPKPTEDFAVTPVITGGVEGVDYKFPENETVDFLFKKGEAWHNKKIIILPAAIGKTITVDFANVPIRGMEQTKFEIITKAYQKPAQPVDYGITFALEGNGGDMSAMTFEKWMVFSFDDYSTVPTGTPVYYTYKVTTADGTDVTNMCQIDMGSPLNIMARNSGYLKVNKGTDDANVAKLKGKKLTVTVYSEDAVIGNNPISFTMAN